ncbi:MAG: hypothetical protein M1830_003866, partial [Pleopsidium flavum]
LNLQHYVWTAEVGYLLHPTIPVDGENITVADIGTGTGIWLLDLARKLPASARLEGLDINLAQTPPEGWLPSNVRFRKLDIFDDVPKDLIEKYDVVHIRHMVLVVRNNNPLPILLNLLKLLKPNGYLQWGEVDLSHRKTVKSNPKNSSESLTQLQNDVQELLHTPLPSWPANLGGLFKGQGMTNVSTNSNWTPDAYLSFVQANALLIQEEIIGRVGGAKMEGLQKVFAKAVAECREGVSWNIERLTSIGQKAETSRL